MSDWKSATDDELLSGGAPSTRGAPATPVTRGLNVGGLPGMRAAATGAARTQAAQEKTLTNQNVDFGSDMQTLHNLGRASKLVGGDWSATPTGPGADFPVINTLELGRTGFGGSSNGPGIMGIHGFPGIPTTEQTANLGELNKLAAQTAMLIGNSGGGTDASRAMAKDSLFGVGKSQQENQRVINNMTRQSVLGVIGKYAQNYWLNNVGGVNDPDPQTGLTYQQFMMKIAAGMPTDNFGDASKYPTFVQRADGHFTTIPGFADTINTIAHTIRGENPAAQAAATEADRPLPLPTGGAANTLSPPASALTDEQLQAIAKQRNLIQ